MVSPQAAYQRRLKADGRCVACAQPNPRSPKVHCQPCGDSVAADKRDRHRILIEDVLRLYGSQCACCGEGTFEFLTIDHINGGGRAHVKRIGGNPTTLYRRIRSGQENKDDYRVLCFNCNSGRQRNGGVCPHERRAA